MSRRLLAFASILFIFLFCKQRGTFAEPAFAQPVTIESLIERAYKNNPDLAVLEERYRLLVYRVPPAGSLPDPTVGVFLMNMGAGVSLGEKEMSQFGFSVSQAFPYSGKRRVRSSIARQEADLLKYDLERKKLEIAGDIRSVYARLYILQETLRLLEAQKGNLRDMMAALEALYVTGRTPQAELLRAQVAISRLESVILERKRQQEALLPELARLVGSPDLMDLPALSEPDIALPSANYDDLWAFVRDGSPDLGRNSAETELDRIRLKEAELEYKPDTMLMFSRSERGKEFGPAWELRADITVPFWKKTKQDYRVKEIRSSLEVHARERERIVVFLRQFLRAALARLERSQSILEHIDGALLPQADLAYQSALSAYPAGKIDLATLLDALTVLYDLRLQRLAFQESILLDRSEILSRGVTRIPSLSAAMSSASSAGPLTGMKNMGG